jgi:hypothetical protein
MRAASSLLLLAVAGAAAAQTDGPRLSVRPHEAIARSLPAFEPKSQAQSAAADLPPDPDVVIMPKMVVEEKELPRITPDELLSRKGRTAKLLAERSSPLDRALNRFHIPILTMSVEQRVNWEHTVNLGRQKELELRALENADRARSR